MPSRPLNILVADDEKHVARLVQVNLERLGHQVDLAHDGLEARAKALTGSFDVIVLDIMMPHMDGLEVLRKIRNHPSLEGTVIILLTVKAQDEDVYKGYSAGADVYLIKPFNPVELATIIEQVAENRP